MNNEKTLKTALSLLFGGSVFISFAFFYQFHLHYQEQFQLFLFTSEEFYNKITIAGGISTYLGRFFTQFYYYPIAGAIIITIFLMLLQRLTLIACRLTCNNHSYSPLSYLPSILALMLLCDEDYLFSGLIVFVLLATMIVLFLKTNKNKYQTVLIPLYLLAAYWFTGGFFVLLAAFIIVFMMIKKRGKRLLWLIPAILTLSFAMPLLQKHIQTQLPLKQAIMGVDIFRTPLNYHFRFWTPGILIIIIPFLLHTKPVQKINMGTKLYIQSAVIIVFAILLTAHFADFQSEEIMAYEYYARTGQWQKITEKADRKTPSTPITIAMLNLALGKQNLLGEKMFYYYQNGNKCLFTRYERNFRTPLITNEIYYHLGLVNIARRQVFDAMELIPNNNKSTRAIKRLTEISLINGNYSLADKYLKILGKTLFYKKWAKNTYKYLYNDSLVEKHPEWGQIRKNLIKKDFLISKQEHSRMLNGLLQSNETNRLAFEYLLSFYLLSKDLGNFEKNYTLRKSFYPQGGIPKSYEEALALYWQLTNKTPQKEIPYEINKQVTQRLLNFSNLLNSGKANKEKIMSYSDTYWHYLKFAN